MAGDYLKTSKTMTSKQLTESKIKEKLPKAEDEHAASTNLNITEQNRMKEMTEQLKKEQEYVKGLRKNLRIAESRQIAL